MPPFCDDAERGREERAAIVRRANELVTARVLRLRNPVACASLC